MDRNEYLYSQVISKHGIWWETQLDVGTSHYVRKVVHLCRKQLKDFLQPKNGQYYPDLPISQIHHDRSGECSCQNIDKFPGQKAILFKLFLKCKRNWIQQGII